MPGSTPGSAIDRNVTTPAHAAAATETGGGGIPLGASLGSYGLAWRRFKGHRLAIVAGAILAALVLIIAIAPLFIPEEKANQAEPEFILRSPSTQFPFGTDDVGRDILARSLYGGRISLTIGATAAFLGIGLGLAVGALAGYYGGVRDAALMRLADAMLSMPSLLLLIVLGRIFGSSVPVLIAVIGGLSWMTVARIVRGNVLSLREQDFVVAARAMGADSRMVLVRHVVPNTLAPVIVAATLGVGNAILLEAGASFLGLGIRPPTASWGSMLYRAQNVLDFAPWVAIFPGLLILVTVLCINFLGDGLRDALDPRIRVE
jgi:peptide/nickel transport system permease protein